MLDLGNRSRKEWIYMAPKYFGIEGDVLSLQIDSEIDANRFSGICSELSQAAANSGKVKLVIVMKHYPSFNSADDLYEDLRFVKLYADVIDKVAIVCDKKWKQTWVALFGLFSGINFEFFDMSETSAALNWIRTD